MRCLSANDLLVATGEALGIAAASDVARLLKPALRRAAYVLAPAARADLVRFVVEPLAPFGDWRAATEAALDDLIVYGDILEMRRLSQEDWGAPAEVLRPAPPTFVRRANGDVMILRHFLRPRLCEGCGQPGALVCRSGSSIADRRRHDRRVSATRPHA